MQKKVDHGLLDLNDALFRELERIENAEGEELEAETRRASQVCNVAGNIIANGRLMLAAAQASNVTAESVTVPKMLLGTGDGQ